MHRAALLALAGALSLAATAAIADDTGLAYSHTLRKEGGRTCMADHYHSGSGEGRSKDAARASAVRSWIDFTNFEYGSAWARFGAALLVTVIDGALQGVAQHQETSGSTVVLNPQGGQQVIDDILRNTINIPPTITVNQGSRLQVIVARDVDFRPVYELRIAAH